MNQPSDIAQKRRRDALVVRNILCATDVDEARLLVPKHPTAAETLWICSRVWIEQVGLVGMEISPRLRNGRRLKELTLKVLVERKAPPHNPELIIPARLPVPGTRRSVPIDIEGIGAGGFDADQRFIARRRPAEAGTPIRIKPNNPATFACILRDTPSGRVFLLSNSHVIANFGRAANGTVVFQPKKPRASSGISDAGIARLTHHISVPAPVGRDNLTDAALAEIIDADRVSTTIYKIGLITGIAKSRPRAGTVVKKFGPASGYTTSEVRDSKDVVVTMKWFTSNSRFKRVWFKDLIRCTKFTEAGDSGSAILSAKNRLLGLHVASYMSSSFFIPIRNVLSEFEREHGLKLELYFGQH